MAAALFVNQGVNPNWYGTLTDINLPEHRATMISLASVMDLAGNALGPLVASYAATLWGLRTAMAAVLLSRRYSAASAYSAARAKVAPSSGTSG